MTGSNDKDGAALLVSEEDVLDYFERNPGLLGWDAIIAYDRNKTNKILLQEYVKRFSGTSWFEPISFDGSATPSVIERVIDYRIDAPRLSFENANLESSRADLKMRIVGGKQLTIENPGNPKLFQITRVKMADALNGPVLHVRINLDAVDVAVRAGRVGIDLSKGTDFYLTYADTPVEDMAGGVKFKEFFDRLPSNKKIFVVSELLESDGIINPSLIALRTQPSPDTHLLGTPRAGDGAVLVFVGLESSDGRGGSIPAKGSQYLLPTGNEGVDALIAFKVSSVFDKMVSGLIEDIPLLQGRFKANYEHGVLTSTEGYLYERDISAAIEISGGRRLEAFTTISAFGHYQDGLTECNGQLVARIEGAHMVIEWNGTNDNEHIIFQNGADHKSCHSQTLFSIRVKYEFVLLQNGRIGIALRDSESRIVTDLYDYDNVLNADDRSKAIPFLEERGRRQLDRFLTQLGRLGFEFDLFVLNNVLFRGQQTFQPLAVHDSGSLITFGQLAPALTTFEIDPVEILLGAGTQRTFATSPAGVSVTWSVANLPGEDGDPGAIDASSGVYTAPARSTMKDFHKRVIITARSRSGNASSSALVGVVTRDIGLDPLVMLVNRGVSGYKVRGTPLDPANALTFRMSPGALGTVIDDPNGDPDVAYSKLYVPPPVLLDAKPGPAAITPQWLEHRRSDVWRIDEDIDQLLAVEHVLVTGSRGGSQEVLVLLPLENLTNWFTYQRHGTGVQLSFWASSKKGDYIVDPEDTTWYLVKGSGTFVNGLYTPAPDTEEAYAVVAAVENDNRNWYWALAILPVPFVTAEHFVNITQEVDA
ncbi:hypothetical protein ACQKO6_02610 [Pseudomonas monteilii]